MIYTSTIGSVQIYIFRRHNLTFFTDVNACTTCRRIKIENATLLTTTGATHGMIIAIRPDILNVQVTIHVHA